MGIVIVVAMPVIKKLKVIMEKYQLFIPLLLVLLLTAIILYDANLPIFFLTFFLILQLPFLNLVVYLTEINCLIQNLNLNLNGNSRSSTIFKITN